MIRRLTFVFWIYNMYSFVFIWFLFYNSSLNVVGVTIPEGSSYRITECAGSSLQASCAGTDKIAIQSIQYGTKPLATCSLSSTSDPCCAYDAGDCLLPYNGTAQQAACSGRSLCAGVAQAATDSSSCDAAHPPLTYPVLSHYLTLVYYCIPDSRISSMCGSSSLPSTGSLLYIKNLDYPSAIRSSGMSCSCSVEISSCSSQIKMYLLHFQLGDGGGNCTGMQKVQINDDGNMQTLTCVDNNDYQITLQFTSTTNYLTITQVNTAGVNDGYFWIGFEGTSNSSSLSVNCPAVARKMCMDCPTLTTPVHGSVSTKAVASGTTVTVSCDPNFTLDGATTLQCQTDGSWDSAVGTCRPDCPALNGIANGSLSTTAVTTGTTVTVSCDPNFSLDGATTLQCQTDGSWNNVLGICRPDCPTLSVPVDGSLSTSAVATGTKVTVSCDPNLSLDGASTLQCQTDGSWDNVVGACRPDCPALVAPADGSLSTLAVSTGTTVIVSCDPNFTLDGASTLQCQTDGTWDNAIGTCRAVLGASCTAETDCTAVISGSTCASNKCRCIDGYIEENNACVKNVKDPVKGLSPIEIVAIVLGIILSVVLVGLVIGLIVYWKPNRNKARVANNSTKTGDSGKAPHAEKQEAPDDTQFPREHSTGLQHLGRMPSELQLDRGVTARSINLQPMDHRITDGAMRT